MAGKDSFTFYMMDQIRSVKTKSPALSCHSVAEDRNTKPRSAPHNHFYTTLIKIWSNISTTTRIFFMDIYFFFPIYAVIHFLKVDHILALISCFENKLILYLNSKAQGCLNLAAAVVFVVTNTIPDVDQDFGFKTCFLFLNFSESLRPWCWNVMASSSEALVSLEVAQETDREMSWWVTGTVWPASCFLTDCC